MLYSGRFFIDKPTNIGNRPSPAVFAAPKAGRQMVTCWRILDLETLQSISVLIPLFTVSISYFSHVSLDFSGYPPRLPHRLLQHLVYTKPTPLCAVRGDNFLTIAAQWLRRKSTVALATVKSCSLEENCYAMETPRMEGFRMLLI